MRIRLAAIGLCALLAACAGRPGGVAAGGTSTGPVEVQLLAFNDFHGNLEPPRVTIDATGPDGVIVPVPAGGAAWFAATIAELRTANPNTLVVSAGDMISASPLASSLFLDEPTIHAMNLIGVDLNAVGNHEFDRGRQELLRLQNGGCAKFAPRDPCQLEPYPGAKFDYLAANTLTEDRTALFAPTALRSFGTGKRQVTIGFIGVTLKDTASLVSPGGIAGLTFADEAATVNRLVPQLRAAGADAIVLLIHQGGATDVGYTDKRCTGLRGDILPILDRLDPQVDVVVSGHTHRAYICDYGAVDPTRPFLLTSAGYGGSLVTQVRLSIDPAAGRVVAKSADNVLVQSEGRVPPSDLFPRRTPDPRVAALVARYVAAAKDVAERPVGRLTAPLTRDVNAAGESALGLVIADSQLAAAPGADVAFMNPGGVRANLVPRADGSVTFGDLYAVQPFGNVVTVKRFTGRQLRAVLEQQFDPAKAGDPAILQPASTLRYRYDLSRPVGSRVVEAFVHGKRLDDDAVYRVAVSNFLAGGGDGFTTLTVGTDAQVGVLDLEALEAWFRAGPVAAPAMGRMTRIDDAPGGGVE